MKRFVLLILILIAGLNVIYGQNERKFVRSGNKLYMEAVKDTNQLDTARFRQAEEEYLKALEKKPGHEKWDFNLADAIYKQMRFDEAESKFSDLGEKLETPEEKARAYHNMGNSQLMQQKIDESIEAYKKALRENPNDLDTKYNLAYAQMLKNQQEEQQDQEQQQDQDQDQDQNQDQNQNQDQQDQQQNQDQSQNQDRNQDQDQNQDQQQQQQPPPKISQQDAEQLLQALQNDERDIQEKVKKEQAEKARKSKSEKEW